MQLNRDGFAKLLDQLSYIVKPNKAGGSILLETRDGGRYLQMAGTDYSTSFLTGTPTQPPSEPFSIALPLQQLRQFVKAQSSSELTLTPKGEQVTFRAGRARMTLNTLPADLVVIPDAPIDIGAKIAGAHLLKLIQSVAFARSKEPSRPELNGIYLHRSNGDLVSAATDLYVMGECKIPCDADLPSAILPGPGLEVLARLVDRNEEIVVARGGNQIAFRSAHWTLFVTMLNGTYPPYGRLIELVADGIVVGVDRVRLLTAVKGLAAVVADAPRLHLQFDRGRIRLLVRNRELGDAEDEIEADYDGEPLAFIVNFYGITSVLEKLAGDRLKIVTKSDNNLLLQPADAGDLTYLVARMHPE